MLVLAALALSWDLGAPGAGSGATASPSSSTIVVGGPPLVGKKAPDFELPDDQGRPVRLADYRGRPVIVYFWNSSCPPCKEEFPLLRAARRAHAADGLEILGIVYKDSEDAASAFMTAYGATWPMLLDPGTKAAAAFGVLAVPESFYVDRSGIVRQVSFGPPPGSSLEALLASILPRASAAPTDSAAASAASASVAPASAAAPPVTPSAP